MASYELPELPEGYFWRVGPGETHLYASEYAFYRFGVSLRFNKVTKRKFRKDRVKEVVISRSRKVVDTNTAAVWNEAHKLYNEWQKRLDREQELMRLSGDYPPKKLK